MWRDDAYLLDMLLAARKVRDFTRNVTREQFQGDELTQNGVMHKTRLSERPLVRFHPSVNRHIRRSPGR